MKSLTERFRSLSGHEKKTENAQDKNTKMKSADSPIAVKGQGQGRKKKAAKAEAKTKTTKGRGGKRADEDIQVEETSIK